MASRSSTITVRILGDTKGLSKALNESEGKVSGFKKVGSKIGGGLMSAATGALKIAGGGAALIGGLAITKGMTRLMGIENAEAKLRGLGHSASAVSGIMENALAAVKGTAFGMDEAATTAAGAVAAGIKPGQELTKYLTLTADAATIAGVSMEEMGSIINKTTTSGKVYADNLNQLADRGIPIFQWLQEEYGVTSEELSKMVREGKVDAETFRKVIGDNIGGAALESGNTTQGAYKNMMAALGRVGANFLSGVFPMFKEGFTGIINLLEPMEGYAKVAGKWLGEFLVKAVDALKAMWPSIQAAARGLADLFEKGVQVFQTLLPYIQPLVDKVQEFFSGVSEGPSKISPLVDFFQTKVIPAVKGVIDAFRGYIEVILPIIIQIAEAIPGYWASIKPYVEDIWNSIKEIIVNVLAVIEQVVTIVTGLVRIIWERWGDDLLSFAGRIWKAIAQLISGVMDVVSGVIKLVLGIITGDWSKAWEGIKQIFSGVWEAIKALLNAALAIVKAVLSAAWEFIKHITGTIWQAILGNLKKTWEEIKGAFNAATGFVKNVVSTAWNWIKSTTSDVWNAIKSFLSGLWDGIKSTVSNAVNSVKTSISDAWNAAKTKTQEVWDGIKNAVKTAISDLMAEIRGIKDKILGAMSGAITWLVDVGKDLIRGMINGVKSMAGALKDAALDVVKSPVNLAKSVLGIGSPSKVFRQFGVWTVEGFAQGLDNSNAQRKVASNVASLTDAMPVGDLRRTLYEAGQRAGVAFSEGMASREGTIASGLRSLAERVASGLRDAFSDFDAEMAARTSQATTRLTLAQRPTLKPAAKEAIEDDKDEALLEAVLALRSDIQRLPKQYRMNERTA